MDKKKIFVIMPFSDEFFESYEMIKRRFEDKFEFSNAGSEDNQQNILADIIAPIYNADIILADLTNLNPNVMYELGIAHTFNKKTIIITRDDLNKLPFDLKQYRAKDYSTHFIKFDELLTYLEKNFTGAIDGSVLFSNPVKDFINRENISCSDIFNKKEDTFPIIDGEKGYVDFIAEIEEDTYNMVKDINVITDKMAIMSEGISDCAREIERVNSQSGMRPAAFVRKQSQKAAEHIGTFGKIFNEHLTSLSTLWDKVENNVVGLMESDVITLENTKKLFTEYLSALYTMKNQVISSKQSIADMKESSLSNLGFERSLNQSIRFLDDELAKYINLSDKMCSSIDKIITKSKYIIGNIDFSTL